MIQTLATDPTYNPARHHRHNQVAPIEYGAIFAHCPPILKAAKQLSASIEKSGRLPASLVPLVYLRVALINGCPF